MIDLPYKFDEIGFWSELKLEIIEKYGAAYTKAFSHNHLKKYYIDAFSGAGVHISKGTQDQIEGSPLRALNISPPFDGYYFIDLDPKKTSYLERACGGKKNVHIFNDDANKCLKDKVFPAIKFEDYKRGLCLLDPYGLDLEWDVILQAGKSNAIDMFLNFPVMDMNRNAIWKNQEKVSAKNRKRMNTFWGDESWKQAAYAESPQGNFFGVELEKQSNEHIVTAFKDRLMQVAGFKHVPDPLPMKNKNNATVYYLFFASQKPVADKIITSIFDKYR